MSLAVFLLPKGDFASELAKCKEKVENQYPNQPYTSHPPHLTIINIDVNNEDKGVAAILEVARFIHPIQIRINRKNVFWNDGATGGHTLFFGIEKNDNLHSLQILVADALQKFKKATPPPSYLIKNKKLLESFKRYGFPFVGDHWIPHFSISSLRSEKSHPIIDDFLSTSEQYQFMIDQISIWRVIKAKHTLLDTVYFT